MGLLTDKDLQQFGTINSLSEKAVALVNHQKVNWPLAESNFKSLNDVKTRSFDFGHFRIDCQFNPGRIRSSAANTDAAVIEARPCFLCKKNMPTQQMGLPFKSDFTILCNPFPIFPYHLTIPLNRHEPQLIEGHICSFLQLTEKLSGFVVFYNGPKCGASAPDHFHFQAGIRNILPIESELRILIHDFSEMLHEGPDVKISAVENYLRRFVYLESNNINQLETALKQVVDALKSPGSEEEPMMNILSWHTNGKWEIVIFPREAQRPKEFFMEDPDKLVIGPAAVELGGLVILPREEDFNKINAINLTSIFDQVTIKKENFSAFKQRLDYIL